MNIRLTRTQLKIVGLVAAGWSARRIAIHLGRSPRTVEKHIENIAATVGGTPDEPPKYRIVRWSFTHRPS